MLRKARHTDTCSRHFGLLGSRGGMLLGRLPNRRGATIVLTLVLMIAFIGMLAFAIDLGYLAHVRTELQRTADACALAAAAKLPDEAAATATVHAAADENGWSAGMKISDGDETHGADFDPVKVEYGFWDRDSATFTNPPPYGADPNAVRVTLRRTQAAGNPIRIFFGRVFGAGEADVEVTATAIYDRWLCGPFVGIESLSAPGTAMTDSYNSKAGLYAPETARDHGSICSDGPVEVLGTTEINGDVRAGEGYWPYVDNNVTITGSIGSRQEPLNMLDVDASVAAVSNDNDQIPLIPEGKSFRSPVDSQGNFLLDGNKVIDMPPGTYYFNDFILTGQAVFNVYGPTTIYVTGNLERSGGTWVNNMNKKPSDLRILMTGGTASVTSDNDFYGVIYAPNTAVTVDGSSDYFGAIVGRTLTITGTGAAHYDESLEMEEVEFPPRTALVD